MNNEMQEMMEMVLKNQEEIIENQRAIIGRLNNLEEIVLRVGSDNNSNRIELDEIRNMVSSLMYR